MRYFPHKCVPGKILLLREGTLVRACIEPVRCRAKQGIVFDNIFLSNHRIRNGPRVLLEDKSVLSQMLRF